MTEIIPPESRDSSSAASGLRLREARERVLDGTASPTDTAVVFAQLDPEIDRMNREVLAQLAHEVKRQDLKHGHFEGTRLGRSRLALGCIEDEVEEAKQAWRDERKADEWTETRAEVLQVAAVAIRALRDAL